MKLSARVPTNKMRLLPEKWNKTCFDLVLFTESTLWFVQVTAGKTHKVRKFLQVCKLKALAPIMKFLSCFEHQVASTRFVLLKNSPQFCVTQL
jgi:hypothetical protein